MPVCALCEHVQEVADTCEVCGRPVLGGGATRTFVTPLVEGFEATSLPPAAAAELAPLPELEPTALEPAVLAGDVAAPQGTADWIEDTALPSAGAVAIEPLEVERVVPEPREPSLEAWRPVVCRYCRTQAGEGQAFCERCGMRLPVLGRAGGEEEPVVAVRCRSCGAVGSGTTCLGCGARLPGAS
jgi:hypothetical protein